MKNIIGLLMVILLLLQGCSTRKKQLDPVPPEKDSIVTTKTVTIIERDTVLVSEPDSIYYEAYVDCVNNKPVLRKPKQQNTPGVKSDIDLKDGKLTVLIQTEAQKLFLKWKEKYILENKDHTRSIPYPVIQKVEVPAEFTFFQKLFLWLGKITFFGLIGLILIKLPWKSFLK